MKLLLFFPWMLFAIIPYHRAKAQLPNELKREFRAEIKAANDFISQHRAILLANWREDFPLLSAVVFPELIRYSAFSDLVETGALKSGYARYGSGFVDFSVGHFQIKPSFAEEVLYGKKLST